MHVRIDMLGGFSVTVDGVAVPDDAWTRRHAAGLVKLLYLARGRRMHREQVIDALWPEVSVDAAGPRLHKAAHYARRALGDHARTIVLRNDLVALLPDAEVHVDALDFRSEAEAALAEQSKERGNEALTEEARESLATLHGEVLRLTGHWEDLVRQDPTDEEAHLAVVRAAAERGDVRGALRQLERLDQALRRELGTAPSPAAEALRRSLIEEPAAERRVAPAAPTVTRLVGRRDTGDVLRERLGQADEGRGSTLLVTGPPGVG